MALNVGIEYELEGIDTNERGYIVPGWYQERDGTLRDMGMEFVLNGKQPIDRAKALVSDLLDAVGDDHSISHRCSTHIHIDTTDLHSYARISLLLGLIAHDDYFFSFGEERKGNSFCCPVLHSPNALIAINKGYRAYGWKDGMPSITTLSDSVPSLTTHDTKYMSINTMPLTNTELGTIELRHFKPLMLMSEVDKVLDRIDNIYDVACKVPINGRAAASEVWTAYVDELPEIKDTIKWVQAMYTTHIKMTRG